MEDGRRVRVVRRRSVHISRLPQPSSHASTHARARRRKRTASSLAPPPPPPAVDSYCVATSSWSWRRCRRRGHRKRKSPPVRRHRRRRCGGVRRMQRTNKAEVTTQTGTCQKRGAASAATRRRAGKRAWCQYRQIGTKTKTTRLSHRTVVEVTFATADDGTNNEREASARTHATAASPKNGISGHGCDCKALPFCTCTERRANDSQEIIPD
jgi:hypothetical protein